MKIQTYLLIAVTIALIISILTRPSNPKPERITQLEKVKDSLTREIKSVQASRSTLMKSYEKDVIISERKQDSLKVLINRKQARQVIIRQVVMTQVDSLPIVKQFILRSDSIQADLTERVTSLEFALISTTKTLKSITENYENELHFTQDRYKIALEEAEVYRKGWKKEQKKVKLFKVLTVAGTVLGLVGGSQL